MTEGKKGERARVSAHNKDLRAVGRRVEGREDPLLTDGVRGLWTWGRG
jgi:hypothetical protein